MDATSVDAGKAGKANYESPQNTNLSINPNRWKINNYNIYDKPVKFIIFNHYAFENEGSEYNREGTDKDAERLETIFKNLGFKEAAHRQEDKTYFEIIDLLNEVLEQSDDWSAIIIVILSHGKENEVCAYDRLYKIENLKNIFIIPKIAEKLAGKPKIFIIQACQGKKVDDGIIVREGAGEYEEQEEEAIIPIMTDFLFAFSSALGYVAYRHEKGSWFIQTLCDAIYDLKDKEDFENILTLVKHDIAYNKTIYNTNEEKRKSEKQIPEVTSTFTKKLYLTRKAVPKNKLTTSSNHENEASDDDSKPIRHTAARNVNIAKSVQDSDTRATSQGTLREMANAKNLMQWIWILLCIIVTLVGTWLMFLKSQPEYHFHCYSSTQNSTDGNVHIHQDL